MREPKHGRLGKEHRRAASDPSSPQSCRSDPRLRISWIVDATMTCPVGSTLWSEEVGGKLEDSRYSCKVSVRWIVVTEDCT